ncbi:MAG: lactate racemase domain-containing protein [Acidobacteriota bacterium]
MVSRRVPYIDRALWLRIPERNLIFEVEPGDLPGVRDTGEAVLAALRRPFGVASLGEGVKGSGRVVIIADDNTRRTPTKRLTQVIAELRKRSSQAWFPTA